MVFNNMQVIPFKVPSHTHTHTHICPLPLPLAQAPLFGIAFKWLVVTDWMTSEVSHHSPRVFYSMREEQPEVKKYHTGPVWPCFCRPPQKYQLGMACSH